MSLCERHDGGLLLSYHYYMKVLKVTLLVLALFAVSSSAALAEGPVSVTPPLITGYLDAYQTLTATGGQWADSSPIVSYTYQWLRCVEVCTDIDYATNPTYTTTLQDLWTQLEVTVVATDAAGYQTIATSNPTYEIGTLESQYAFAESNVGPGSISGSASDGSAASNLACPSACGLGFPYAPGTQISLMAVPDTGATFAGWTGACLGTAPTCEVTIGSVNTSVEAHFIPPSPPPPPPNQQCQSCSPSSSGPLSSHPLSSSSVFCFVNISRVVSRGHLGNSRFTVFSSLVSSGKILKVRVVGRLKVFGLYHGRALGWRKNFRLPASLGAGILDLHLHNRRFYKNIRLLTHVRSC